MKNSSRLLAEIDRKRSRSSRGWPGLAASSSTRPLKASQEVSRLKKRSGEAISASDSSSCGAREEGTSSPVVASWIRVSVMTGVLTCRGRRCNLAHARQKRRPVRDRAALCPWADRLPGPGVADDVDDVAVVVVDQIDVVIHHDPAGALGREAEAVGPPVVQLIPP